MLSYLTMDSVELLTPPIITSIFFGVIAFFVTNPWKRGSEAIAVGLAIFSYALLGFLVGLMSGNSRQPVVGAVIPAMLTLIAAAGLYVSSQDNLGRVVFLGAGMSTLVLTLFTGIIWGSRIRANHEAYIASLSYRIERALDDAAIQITVEKELYSSRQRLGLPTNPTTSKP